MKDYDFEQTNENANQWNAEDIYNGVTSLDNMVRTIETLDYIRDACVNSNYRNEEDAAVLTKAMDIVRDEVCRLFGGSINN